MPLRIGYYTPTPGGMGGKKRHLLALIDHFRAGYHISVFCDPADAGNLFHAELNARGLRAGYEAACTTIQGINRSGTNPLALLRIGVQDDPPAVFAFKLSRFI